MKTILYPQTDGKLAVVYPTSSADIAAEAVKVVPSGTAYLVADMPSIDHAFFGAYTFDATAGAVFDAAAAGEIQRNRWRTARKPLLAALDVAWMKALESGDTATQTSVTAQKTALRNVTATEISGTTPAEIKAAWPEILGTNPYL
ncbi:MAG: hypothetical protein ACFUZC_05020 [Chthoniobacteraceae bacterium]